MSNYHKILIETERLYIRPILESDFDDLCLLDMDPEVRSFFPEGALNAQQVRKELDRFILEWGALGFGIFSVVDKESMRFIGRCGFAKLRTGEVEVGYLLLKDYWGKGIATEAANAVIEWGRHHIPVDHIIGWAPLIHVASIKILEKCGMIFDHYGMYQNLECGFYQIESLRSKED